VGALAAQHVQRPEALKRLDVERDLTPDWFQRERMVGYVFYVERFAGDLAGVLDHLDYLAGARRDLRPPHVRAASARGRERRRLRDRRLPRRRPAARHDRRPGRSARALRERGIATCVDLVLNHCADTHAGRGGQRGDEHHRDYFYTYPDRTEPDAFEATLPEVFPDFAPGNFTWDELDAAWVWTTFNAYQWDLNWSNPDVFLEVVDIMGDLANRGVDVFRMDAVAFMWKRLGTDCQNQPEVHDLHPGAAGLLQDRDARRWPTRPRRSCRPAT
jgi:amylosucrase